MSLYVTRATATLGIRLGDTLLNKISRAAYISFTRAAQHQVSFNPMRTRMKKICFAIGTSALIALGAMTAPAHADQRSAQRYPHHRAIVVPAPPAPHFNHYRGPRWHGDRHHYRSDTRRYYRRHGMRDNDRDGVPNRYDRRPNNPYRY